MIDMKNESLFKSSIVIGVAMIVISIIGAWAYVSAKRGQQSVVVTGSAKKRIKSDLIIWRSTVTTQAAQLSDASKILNDNVPRVKNYLMSKGVSTNQIIVSSIKITTLYAVDKTKNSYGEESQVQNPSRITGYSLSQYLEVRSNEVDKVTNISREVTELINQGIILESESPQYHYTKLGDLKVEMLAEASKDAKNRAQQIATNTGADIGNVRAARMGVLQITAANSNEISGFGVNDTSSLDKDITAVVSITFALD